MAVSRNAPGALSVDKAGHCRPRSAHAYGPAVRGRIDARNVDGVAISSGGTYSVRDWKLVEPPQRPGGRGELTQRPSPVPSDGRKELNIGSAAIAGRPSRVETVNRRSGGRP